MAPQTSAISSSPASGRPKSKLSHLAFVDPSSIRRSSGSTPSGSWGRSGGVMSCDRSALPGGGRLRENCGGRGGSFGAENLGRFSRGIGRERSDGGGGCVGGSHGVGRERFSTCLALIDPNSTRRSSATLCADGRDGGSRNGGLESSVGGSSFRRSSRLSNGEVSSMFKEPLTRSRSESAESSVEEGSKGKRARREPEAAPSTRKKEKKRDTVSFFVGDPVPDKEAKRRWPWRFEKERECRKSCLEPDENDDELVLNVKCHYLQAEVSKYTFELGDYAYVKGETGGENYIGKIIEFFKTNDDEDYFRVQWFFRAVDTVMRDAAESHDKKRLFYSDLMNDNLLDCIVSRLKIIQIQPNARVKSKSTASYDFYYDMKYSVDYSTFCTMTSNNLLDKKNSLSLDREPFHSNGTVPKIEEQNGNKPCKSESTLLDVYSGCGAMSTGLCLGAKLSGQVLTTKWSLDINKSACETLKLNHPETQVRNESAEDFLDLLKEWDSLCKQYAVNRKGDTIKSHSKALRGAEKSIPSGKSDKSTEGEYEVEKIVDICYGDTEDSRKRGLKCKVRWAGFGPSEDTWEPIDGLRKCQAAIKDFVQKGFTSKILPRPGDVDVICGGPPCQGVSGYNRHRNYESPMDDERNHQIVVFMDLVKFLKPKYVLMENVPDILRFAKGTLGRYALSRLVQMNYQARLGIMAAGCYGLAQFRLRVFLWGANPYQFRLRVFLWGANPYQHLPHFPLPTHDAILRYGAPTEFERNIVAYDEGQTHKLEKALKLADAISDLPSISNFEAGEEMKYSKPPETEFQKYIRATESEMLGFSPSAEKQAGKAMLYDHQAFPLSPDDYLRVCLIPKRKGANFRDLPGVTVDKNNYVRRDPSTEQTLPSGKSYVPDYAINFYEGKSMRPFGRLWWDETVPTVTCKPDPHSQAVLHPEQDRILSLRECARLQGFPDYYRFRGSPKERYRQVGNAVAVPVARALGYALGLAFQQVGDPSQPLITLPPKFSHSTTYELLHSASSEINLD